MRRLATFACLAVCGLLCTSAARVRPCDATRASIQSANRVAEAAAAAGLLLPPDMPAATERRRTLALPNATPDPGVTGRFLKDAISSEVNAIAAAACAMVGPVQCRESREFVRRMEAFCSQQYGYTRWDEAHWNPLAPRFECDALFFACFALLGGDDAALTAQSCCASQSELCQPCLEGNCQLEGMELLSLLSSPDPDTGMPGYCDRVFMGACCTCHTKTGGGTTTTTGGDGDDDGRTIKIRP